MVGMKVKKNTGARPAIRFSRDLALQLKAAETALKKAAAIAAKMGKGRSRCARRVARAIS